jgi:hypothetical protein
MAPRNVSKQQAEQADTGEDSESEQETLDPKVISRDMEKNVGTTRIELPAHRCDLYHVTSPTTQLTPDRRTPERLRSAISYLKSIGRKFQVLNSRWQA